MHVDNWLYEFIGFRSGVSHFFVFYGTLVISSLAAMSFGMLHANKLYYLMLKPASCTLCYHHQVIVSQLPLHLY